MIFPILYLSGKSAYSYKYHYTPIILQSQWKKRKDFSFFNLRFTASKQAILCFFQKTP